MLWTRKSLTETSGWFNNKPLTPLDETLRVPIALDEIFGLLKKEYGIVLKKPLIIHNGYFYFRNYFNYFLQLVFQPRAYFLLWRLFREAKKAKVEWEKMVERFTKEFEQLKQEDWTRFDNRELFEHIKELIKFEAYWIFKLGGGLHTIYHYFSEILLYLFYGLLVKDKNSKNYQELLIGYPNKLKEADLAFWKVVKREVSLDDYLEKYGFRATDLSLAIPTIGEDKKMLQARIEAFRGISMPDFEKIQIEVLEKRKLREEYVLNNFRSCVPFGKRIFSQKLGIAREYIPVRETRRFYYTKTAYFIRKSLLILGERLEFLESPNDIFFLTKNELEKIIFQPGVVKREEIKGRIITKKKQWQEWNEQALPEQIKL